MPPSRKPTSSHSSRPSRPSGSSHRPSSHHSAPSHHSSYHHSPPRPPRHSGYGRQSGGGFLSGMALGGILAQREQEQNRSTTVINQQIVTAPQPKMYQCPFCLGKVTGKPAENGLQSLTCPNCGGVLDESNAISEPQPAVQPAAQSYAQPQSYSSSPDTSIRAYPNQPSLGYKLKSCLGTFLAIGIIGGIIGFAVYIAAGGKQPSIMHDDYNNGYYEDYDDGYGYGGHEDSIYVDVLGRTCYWDEEYQTYYDRDTDCYFFMNYDMNPPVWQYWFEGISSNYGENYGWMEWDYDKCCWYVQKSSNSWVKLPENEYTDWLWHMD